MHAHEIKDSDEFKAATGTGGVYVHQPFPTTLFREPKRDDLGHIIAEKLVSRVVNTPEEMEKINRDIWRESPAAWDDDYVPYEHAATQAEALKARLAENEELLDENAQLRAQLAEAQAKLQEKAPPVPPLPKTAPTVNPAHKASGAPEGTAGVPTTAPAKRTRKHK